MKTQKRKYQQRKITEFEEFENLKGKKGKKPKSRKRKRMFTIYDQFEDLGIVGTDDDLEDFTKNGPIYEIEDDRY